MSIEVRARRVDRREVKWLVGHDDVLMEDIGADFYVGLVLTDDDRFDAQHRGRGWSRDEGPFQVRSVSYAPQRYRFRDEADLEQSEWQINLRGLRYKKDGTVGKRDGSRSVRLDELPESVYKALIAGWEEVRD